MELLRFDGPLDETLVEPVMVVALDGWTDAGRCGSVAAERLQAQWHAQVVASFDGDALYDYRDRRPILSIDRGLLGEPTWPSLDVFHLHAGGDKDVLLVQGGEPDFAWRQLCADIVELAAHTGAQRYVGLGAVPAPVPHTRPTRLTTTGSDEELLDRFGRPHERLTVPASCQVIIEAALRDAGLRTLGLWARIPHYVAGEYPAGALVLLDELAAIVEADVDLSEVRADADAHRQRLDLAARSSDEISSHIQQLEAAYDADVEAEASFGPLPSGDEIAAEFEQFLRRQSEPDDH
ncbi:MAG: PAC2 family protein [Actinobacteria bacterium]|nr:PAC2 family protein [Actinomycetota bacterium]